MKIPPIWVVAAASFAFSSSLMCLLNGKEEIGVLICFWCTILFHIYELRE